MSQTSVIENDGIGNKSQNSRTMTTAQSKKRQKTRVGLQTKFESA